MVYDWASTSLTFYRHCVSLGLFCFIVALIKWPGGVKKKGGKKAFWLTLAGSEIPVCGHLAQHVPATVRHVLETGWSPNGGMKQTEGGSNGSGTRYTFQEHVPNDLCPPTGPYLLASSTSQACHQVTNLSVDESVGDATILMLQYFPKVTDDQAFGIGTFGDSPSSCWRRALCLGL